MKQDWINNIPDWLPIAVAIGMFMVLFIPLILQEYGVRWPFILWCVGFAGLVLMWPVYEIYCKVAYGYTIERVWAEVTEKEHVRFLRGPDSHFVGFKTDGNLIEKIDDLDLYDWAEKGKRFKVTLKVWRSRSRRPVPRRWKVIDYTFR